MNKEFSDFIFKQNWFLDYDKFNDFKVSLHGEFEDHNGHLYRKYDNPNYKYHLWVIQSNVIFQTMYEGNIPDLKKYITDTFPPTDDTWNDEGMWVVIDRKTEALDYQSTLPLLDLLMEMGYNIDRIKFLSSSHEIEKSLVGFTLELYVRAQYFRLSDPEFIKIYMEFDKAINHEYKGTSINYKKWLLDLESPKLLEKRPYTFLNYNGTLPDHKLALLSEIYRRKLENYFLLSATNRDGSPIDTLKERLYQFNPDADGKIFDLLPIYLDITKDMDSELSSFKHGVYRSEIGNSNPKKIHYNQTYFSVISETSFDRTRLVGVPWKAMILHPFILNAGVHSLELFKSFGFKSFPDIFDESYDEIEDDKIRHEFLMNEIERICLLSEEEKHKLYLESIPTIKYNQNHLCNFDLDKFLLDIFNQVVS